MGAQHLAPKTILCAPQPSSYRNTCLCLVTAHIYFLCWRVEELYMALEEGCVNTNGALCVHLHILAKWESLDPCVAHQKGVEGAPFMRVVIFIVVIVVKHLDKQGREMHTCIVSYYVTTGPEKDVHPCIRWIS